MEFDKSRVYTALNADEVKPGSKVFVADNLFTLRQKVEDNTGQCLETLKTVNSDTCTYRFVTDTSYALCYLVSEPEEKIKVYYDMVLERLLTDTIVPASGRVYFTTNDFDTAAEWIREHLTLEPVMKAYEKEKKVVQFRRQDDADGGWITLNRTPIWDMHYRYRVKPDEPRRMTNRELARWLAQGNGEWRSIGARLTGTSYNYEMFEDANEVLADITIRGWDEAEWHEPIVQEVEQ